MARIFTRTGDQGLTRLANGERVAKDDIRIELNGEMDELNAMLGLIKAKTEKKEPLESLQRLLQEFMGFIARPDYVPEEQELQAFVDATVRMEAFMQAEEDHAPFSFVLPGESVTSALLHLARAKARTCERRLVTLNRTAHMPAQLGVFLNRLSDYLFVLALI